MNSHDAADRIVNSTASQLLSRIVTIALPFVISGIAYFGSQWLDGRFSTLEAKQTYLATKVETLNTAIADNSAADAKDHDRLLITEEGLRQAREDRDRFQKQALDALAQLQDTTRRQAETLAAVNATLVEMQKQRFPSNR